MQLPFDLLQGGSFRCTPAWRRREPMTDDCHRCYFPRQGRAWVERDGLRCDLRPGRIYLIPGYRLLRYACDRQLDLDWCHFRAADLETELKLARLDAPVVWPAQRWRSWGPTWRRMDELFTAIPAASTSLMLQVQAMLLCFLADLAPTLDRTVDAFKHDLHRLEPAVAFMDEHFKRNPSLAEVAARVHLSPTHFHRRFRQALGVSPRHYMLRRRMELARELLRHGDMNVTEVAHACGYETVFHFSRVFKAFYHCRPRDAGRVEVHRAP